MSALVRKDITVQLERDDLGPYTSPEEVWPKFSRETPEAYAVAMTQGLPTGTQIHVELTGRGELTAIDFTYFNKLPGGEEEDFTISRRIHRYSGAAKALGNTEMTDGLQAQGICRTIDSRVFGLYLQQGVERAEITATKINTYAAARKGFVPYDDEAQWGRVRRLIADKLNYLEAHLAPVFGPVPIEASDAIRAGAETSSPKGMWRIVDVRAPYAGVPLGKLVTIAEDYLPLNVRQALCKAKPAEQDNPFAKLAASWRGYFDFKTDADFLTRARAYLNAPLTPPSSGPSDKPVYAGPLRHDRPH